METESSLGAEQINAIILNIYILFFVKYTHLHNPLQSEITWIRLGHLKPSVNEGLIDKFMFSLIYAIPVKCARNVPIYYL